MDNLFKINLCPIMYLFSLSSTYHISSCLSSYIDIVTYKKIISSSMFFYYNATSLVYLVGTLINEYKIHHNF